MNDSLYKGILPLLLMITTTSSHAIDLMKYARTGYDQINETARTTVLGIIESCGNGSNIKDDCVISGFKRVDAEENNVLARTITMSYEQALLEGNFANPECEIETHSQANHIIGHCILLSHYFALRDQNDDMAISQYKTCLRGGLQGLVYQGNIVAQFMLEKLMIQNGIPEAAQLWHKALKLRKNTDEYVLLKKCYK